MRWGVVALVVIVVGYLIFGRGGGGATKYVTQEVTRGDLTVTVTATGNLEPRNQVDIGSELSGTIRSVAVDVNDEVKAGQVLTKLDTSRLEAQVLQAQSSLASAAGARAAERGRAEGSAGELRAAAEGARAERQQAPFAAGHGRRRSRQWRRAKARRRRRVQRWRRRERTSMWSRRI